MQRRSFRGIERDCARYDGQQSGDDVDRFQDWHFVHSGFLTAT
jgi:hypothetical protein